jgi:O-antigen/teichoic acid export membrane protein
VFISSDKINTTLLGEIVAYTLYFPSFVGGLILLSVLRAEHKMLQRSLLVYVLPNILNLIFILSLIFVSMNSNVAIMARALSYSVLFLFLLFVMYSYYNLNFPNKIKLEKPKELSWLFLTSLTFIIESGVLAIWCGKYYLTAHDFGVLAVILRLSALVLLVPVAITLVLGPVLAKEPLNKVLRNKMFIINFGGVFITLIFIWLFSKYLLIFFGQEYVEYERELIILSVAMSILAASQPLNSVFISLKRKHFISISAGLSVTCFFLTIGYVNNITLSTLLNAMILSIISFSTMKWLMYKI